MMDVNPGTQDNSDCGLKAIVECDWNYDLCKAQEERLPPLPIDLEKNPVHSNMISCSGQVLAVSALQDRIGNRLEDSFCVQPWFYYFLAIACLTGEGSERTGNRYWGCARQDAPNCGGRR